MRADVKCRAAENTADKLNEGLKDILNLLRQKLERLDVEDNHPSDERSEQSELSENGELVHQIIAKFFKIVRLFESQTMELQHQCDKTKLQLEDSDNIKFDLEILHDEKLILESELD